MQSFARTSRALSFWCLLCCLRLLPSCSCLLCESKKQANEKHLNAFPAVVAVFFYNNFLYLDYDWICFDLGLGSGIWFFERTVFSLSFFFSSIFFFIEAVQWIVRLTCSCLWFLNLIAIVNFSYTYWYIFIVYVSYCGKVEYFNGVFKLGLLSPEFEGLPYFLLFLVIGFALLCYYYFHTDA